MRDAIRSRIEAFLSKEYGCDLAVLNGKETVFTVWPDIGRPYIKIMAYRNCVVVCSSEELHIKLKTLLEGRNRDVIFELPFVYGQTIHYVPEKVYKTDGETDSDYTFDFYYGDSILSLRGGVDFPNSLAFDGSGLTPTRAACLARMHGRVAGAAGASETAASGLMEAGVDVVEGHRNAGLGTRLIRRLTGALLDRDVVPFYSASVTNIGSQMIASRCGYIPMWVDTYGTILDGSSDYHEIVSGLSL